MRGMLGIQKRYGSEAGCIGALDRLRWPQGYVCARCGLRRSYQLKTRALQSRHRRRCPQRTCFDALPLPAEPGLGCRC